MDPLDAFCVTAAHYIGCIDDPRERRQARALTLLQRSPNWRRIIVSEPGDTLIIGVAVWRDDVADYRNCYTELEIPPTVDAALKLFALLNERHAPPH